MTVVWAWSDLGNHTFQKHNIKQYWLLMSVVSVKKFNPDWKRVFLTDEITATFIEERGWTNLWDEVIVKDFTNTEYGNLYDIKIYSWPKLYSYGIVDDDILVLDIDIVFTSPFVIDNPSQISGAIYNHYDDFLIKTAESNLRWKWNDIDCIQKELYKNGVIDDMMEQKTMCYIGAPIYCPRKYTKALQSYILNHIQKVEKYYGDVAPNGTFYSIEEEFPLSQFARNNTGMGIIDRKYYRHGYVYEAKYDLTDGFEKAELILGESVFEKYLKNNG
jgi:hypothetical protein